MAAIPHNIEPRTSTGPFGRYRAAYGAGLVWHVSASNSSFGRWCAKPAPLPSNASLEARRKADRAPTLYAFTLAELGAKMDALVINL